MVGGQYLLCFVRTNTGNVKDQSGVVFEEQGSSAREIGGLGQWLQFRSWSAEMVCGRLWLGRRATGALFGSFDGLVPGVPGVSCSWPGRRLPFAVAVAGAVVC